MAKRNRRGRPPSPNAQRSPCGKVKKDFRQPRGETEAQIKATVLAYRAREVGAEHAGDARAGYELGRLAIRKAVTKRQHEAGCTYALLVGAYQRLMGFPPPYPQGIDLGAARGLALGGEPGEQRIARIANEYMRAHTALAQIGRLPEWAVREVCVYDRPTSDVDNLARGLDALADFFGVPGERVDEKTKSA